MQRCLPRLSPARAVAATLALFALACGTTQTARPAWQWSDPTPWLEQDADDGRSAYVTLLHEERFTFLYGRKFNEGGRTEIHRHTVHKILSEAAFDAAEVTVDWPRRGALLQLEARTIAPDGTVIPVDSAQFFDLQYTRAASGDDAADRWRDTELRRFRFPRVEVGSLIELAYTVEINSPYTGWSSMIGGAVPIKEYRAEIVVEPGAQPDLMVINKAYPLELEPHGDGMQHLVLKATDVPALPREVGSPIARASAPWWMYRTIAYRSPNNVWNMNGTWDDVARTELSSVLLKKKALDGLPALKDGAVCNGDARCLVAAALKQARSTVALERSCDFFELRKLEEIVDDGYGSSCDRALVLWGLLTRAGVDARLAGATRPHTLRPDRSFPTAAWLNQALVVAVIGGEKVWIDPECEGCAPGELSTAVDTDGDALVAAAKSSDEVAAEWWPVRGALSPVQNVRTELWRVTLNKKGGAKLELDERRSGDGSWGWRVDARTNTKKEHEEAARGSLRRVFSTARVDGHEPVRCDAAGLCKRSARGSATQVAAVDVDGLRMDFAQLGTVMDLEQADPRTLPFVAGTPRQWFTEVRITPPDGMRVASLPTPRKVTAELVSVEISATRDNNDVIVRRVVTLSAGKVPTERVAAVQRAFHGADVSSTLVVVEPAR